MKEHATVSLVRFEVLIPAQDAHKVGSAKPPKGRKKRFGPLETKHTVTSVVWLPDSQVVASSGKHSASPERRPPLSSSWQR